MSIYINDHSITTTYQTVLLDKTQIENDSEKKFKTILFINNNFVKSEDAGQNIEKLINGNITINEGESDKKLIDNVKNFIRLQQEKSTINTILEKKISSDNSIDIPSLPNEVAINLSIKDNQVVINTLVKITEYKSASSGNIIKSTVGQSFAEIDAQCNLNDKSELISSALVVSYEGSGENLKATLDAREFLNKWLQQIANFLGIIDLDKKIQNIKANRPTSMSEKAEFVSEAHSDDLVRQIILTQN